MSMRTQRCLGLGLGRGGVWRGLLLLELFGCVDNGPESLIDKYGCELVPRLPWSWGELQLKWVYSST